MMELAHQQIFQFWRYMCATKKRVRSTAKEDHLEGKVQGKLGAKMCQSDSSVQDTLAAKKCQFEGSVQDTLAANKGQM